MAIIDMLEKTRVATGDQIQRVHFRDVQGGHTRDVVRARVLKRLCDWRVLVPIHRHAGGIRRGKAGYAYALDVTGQRVIARQRILNMQAGTDPAPVDVPPPRTRPPRPPGDRFLAHALAVTEIYVRLRLDADANPGGDGRSGGVGYQVADFQTEPACWWPPHPPGTPASVPNGGGRPGVKPDAYVALRSPSRLRHTWIEVDMGTEHVSALTRQLSAYADFARSGQAGPGGVLPRVLFTTQTAHRADAIRAAVQRAGTPATDFVSAVRAPDAVATLTAGLHIPPQRRGPS